MNFVNSAVDIFEFKGKISLKIVFIIHFVYELAKCKLDLVAGREVRWDTVGYERFCMKMGMLIITKG
jgi:hypothetical protein